MQFVKKLYIDLFYMRVTNLDVNTCLVCRRFENLDIVLTHKSNYRFGLYDYQRAGSSYSEKVWPVLERWYNLPGDGIASFLTPTNRASERNLSLIFLSLFNSRQYSSALLRPTKERKITESHDHNPTPWSDTVHKRKISHIYIISIVLQMCHRNEYS